MASTAADSKGLDSQSKKPLLLISIAIETCYRSKVLSSDLMLYVRFCMLIYSYSYKAECIVVDILAKIVIYQKKHS